MIKNTQRDDLVYTLALTISPGMVEPQELSDKHFVITFQYKYVLDTKYIIYPSTRH